MNAGHVVILKKEELNNAQFAISMKWSMIFQLFHANNVTLHSSRHMPSQIQYLKFQELSVTGVWDQDLKTANEPICLIMQTALNALKDFSMIMIRSHASLVRLSLKDVTYAIKMPQSVASVFLTLTWNITRMNAGCIIAWLGKVLRTYVLIVSQDGSLNMIPVSVLSNVI